MIATDSSPAREAADQAGILAAVEDYVQGWYQAEPARTERCLHPQLAKRLVRQAPEGGTTLDEMGAATLIGYVRDRAGTPPPARQLQAIEILGVFDGIASVRAEMNDWVDFLHLGRFDGEWKIVNVVWALKPREVQA